MYDRASDLFFSSNKRDMKEIEEFCRGCAHTEDAFNEVISRLLSIDPQFVKNNMEFLIQNLDWMDTLTLLSWIPPETKISDIEPLLIAIDALFIQKDAMNRMRLSISKNLEIDTEYQFVKARKRAAEVQAKTNCNSCGRPVGQGWLAVSPSFGLKEAPDFLPEVYHLQCKPVLKGSSKLAVQ